jgi:hypothetical protein
LVKAGQCGITRLSGVITISAGKASTGVPAIGQNSVPTAPGHTAWMRMGLPASSWRRDWLKPMTYDFVAP